MHKNIRNPNGWRRHITLEKCLVIIFVLLATEIVKEHQTALASGRGKPSMPDATKNVAGSSPRKRLGTDAKQKGQKSELLPASPGKLQMSVAGTSSSQSKRLRLDSNQEGQKSELLSSDRAKPRVPDSTRNVAGSSQGKRLSAADSKQEVQKSKLPGGSGAADSSQNKRLRLDSKSKDYCTSDKCAQEVLSKMNKKADPCDDFYEFACGNYVEATKIPDDKSYVNEFVMLETEVQEQLKTVIEQEKPTKDPKYLKLPNLLYKACTNEKLIEDIGTKDIKQIAQSLGGWPVVVGHSWDKDNTWTWQETVKNFKALGFSKNIVITLTVTKGSESGEKLNIALDQYKRLKFNQNPYYKYMVDVAVLLGAEKEAAKAELKESVLFEIELKKISLSAGQRRDKKNLNVPRTIKQLQKLYPYVQWLDYINALLPEVNNIDENTVVNVVVPSYFDKLGELLRSTGKRILANYMMWRMHEEVLFGMPQKFREAKFKYESILTGHEKQGHRWSDCIDFISDRLSLATGSLYVRKYFQQDSKAAVTEMTENIRNTFTKTLDGLDWMDQNTKKEAKKKLHAMKVVVGYPKDLLDDVKLEEYYGKLQITADKLIQSILNINIFLENMYSKNPVISAHSINAVYKLSKNTIEIPAAMLQGYFFNAQRPNYINYGAMGSLIGHEITHAFDNNGRRYDSNGKLVNWWQPKTEKDFLEKAQCIVKQYSGFKEKQTGRNINGVRTQGENIADNGGFKHSYLAYKQWVEENGEELPLPGLTKYTWKQLFWISAAQTWCAKYRKESIEHLLNNGCHSPEELRIFGAFRNIDSFSNDFNCPLHSPMNPVYKCKIW